MKKAIKRSLIFAIGFMVLFSFADYTMARTMYGGMSLSQQNLLVVAYKTLDYILQGFIF